MIYTVGDTEVYQKLLADAKATGIGVVKTGYRPPGEYYHLPSGYSGGLAFQTYNDARRFITEHSKDEWSVFALLNAVWNVNTTPADDGWWHYLLHDCLIAAIEG